jgi:hypothetical protein
MDERMASEGGYRTVPQEIQNHRQSAPKPAPCLTRPLALIVALLLSLGLWWAIWEAATSLASALVW